MDWQQITSLLVVAVAALLLIRQALRRRLRTGECGTCSSCSAERLENRTRKEYLSEH